MNYKIEYSTGALFPNALLIYKENQQKLNIPLERLNETSFASSSEYLKKWSLPENKEISIEEKKLILLRITKWCLETGKTIDFGSGMTKEEIKTDYRKKGWTVTDNPDGTFTCFPP